MRLTGFEWRTRSGAQFPETASETGGRKLEVSVVFTTLQGTLAALQTADELARDLGAQIRILLTQVVPYPLPLASCPVFLPFTERRLHALASQAAVPVRAHVYLCRDSRQALLEALEPESLVVIGGNKRWWPTREESLARLLRSQGHQVILVVATKEETTKLLPNSSH